MTSGLPKISIVTPSYNQGKFVKDCIESVRQQDYPNVEHILVDGGSTDETLDVIRRYGTSMNWVSEKDDGQSNALNKGFEMATGEIYGFLNTDDRLEPGALLKVGNFFLTSPRAAWVTGRCRIVGPDGSEIRKGVTAYKNAWLLARSTNGLKVVNFISQPATFWRREAHEATGPFDETLHYSMDYDYWLRMAKRYRLHVINSYLAQFRIHPASKAGASLTGQFDAGLEIAKRHVRSSVLLRLNRLHIAAIVRVYKSLQPGKTFQSGR